MTTEPESIAERRAAGPRTRPTAHTNEPTIEIRIDRQPPPAQPAGRWWSGQPDDDETIQDEAPWAAEPTVEERQNGPAAERRKGPFRRRR